MLLEQKQANLLNVFSRALYVHLDSKDNAEKVYTKIEYNYFLSAFMCILKCRREYVQILEIVCLFQTGCVIKCLCKCL